MLRLPQSSYFAPTSSSAFKPVKSSPSPSRDHKRPRVEDISSTGVPSASKFKSTTRLPGSESDGRTEPASTQALTQAAEVLRKAKSMETRLKNGLKKLNEGTVRSAKISALQETEVRVAAAQAVFHRIVMALRPDSPGVTYLRIADACSAAINRLRAAQNDRELSHVRVAELQQEWEHLKALRAARAQIEWNVARFQPTPSRATTPSMSKPANINRSPDSAGSSSIAALLDDTPAPALSE